MKQLCLLMILLLNGCVMKDYRRTKDWWNGYAEGHNDGVYMGYKIKENEMSTKIIEDNNNEINR